MNKKIFGIIMCILFIGASIIPSYCSIGERDQIDQQHTVHDDGGGQKYGAQSFKPTLNTLSKVELFIYRQGDPSGNYIVSIRSSLDGNDLTSITIPASYIPPYPYTWIQFDFQNIHVIPENTYYIVTYVTGYEGSHYIGWGGCSSGDYYTRGSAYYKPFASWPWEPHWVIFDFNFKTYGYNNNLPTADAGGPYSGNVGESIQLDGSGSYDSDGTIVSYEWDLDDDGQYDDATGETTTYSWSTSGTHAISLKVTDNDNAEDTDDTTVEINSPPIADANGPYYAEVGESIQLDGSGSYDSDGTIVSYEWDLDDDGQYDDATGEMPYYSWSTTGIHNIGLKVTDDDSGSGTDSSTVEVNNPIIADANGPYTGTVCDPVSFTGSASEGFPPYSYSWDFGDGETSDQQNPTHQYDTDDTYTVTLTVTDNLGYTDDDTTTCEITHPTLNVDAGGPYEEKVGNLVFFTGSASGGCPPYTYSWDFDDSDGIQEDSTEQNPTHAYQDPGGYTVTLTVTDDKYYSSIDIAIATITPLEVEADAGGPYYGGVDVPIQFIGNAYEGAPPYEYYWDFGDGTHSDEKDPTHIYTEPSPPEGYEVFLTVTDSENNLDWDNTYAYISSDIENPTANAGGPYHGYTNQGIQFSGDAFGGIPPYSFSWDFDDSDGIQEDSTEQNPIFTYVNPGVYTVTLTVSDDTGKSDIDTTTATVNPSMPDLRCEGSLSWNGVKPGETITGTITVENIGGTGTLLDWQVESTIGWGDWTFTPESGEDLTPEDEPVTITVTVIAPDEKNTEFTGDIHLVNKNNPQDKCIIPVSLTTSKIKTIDIQLLRFLENYPILYQLLQRFFKL
jgi:PKD repeat protein